LKPRRAIFWLTLLLGVLLGAVWLFSVPYRPDRLFRAIPANAGLVSIHHHLAARWPALLRNPLLQSLVTSMGAEPSALPALATEPEVLDWVRRLGSRDLVVAYAPRLGARQTPAWVIASWVGGRSQVFRWQLSWLRLPGFARQTPHAGIPYWTVRPKGLQPGLRFALAPVEGLVIGCLSADDTAMLELLETYGGQRPSLAAVRQTKLSDYWCLEPAAPDHGWLDPNALRGAAGVTNPWPTLTYSLTAIQPGHAAGQVCLRLPLPAVKAGTQPMAAGGLASLLGDLPVATVMLRTEFMTPLLEEQLGAEWGGMLGACLKSQRSDRVMLALLGGDYGGQFYGFRVPALVAGVPIKSGEATLLMLRAVLDRLNARRGWGLIPHAVRVGDRTAFVVEGTAQNAFAALPAAERPAYAVIGNWLLAASSLPALTNLLARYDRPEAEAQAGSARWTDGLDSSRGTAYAWVDLARAQKEFRLVAATYSLKLLLDDPRESQARRQQLNELTAWLTALAPLGQAKLWLTSDGQMTAVQLELGTPAK